MNIQTETFINFRHTENEQLSVSNNEINALVKGEGDYISGKTYQEMQHEFAEKGPVKQKAREAEEALDGPEGADLEAARRETGEGKTH